MKKLYTGIILSISCLCQTVNAQSTLPSVAPKSIVALSSFKGGNTSFFANDTLLPPSFGMPLQCDTAPKLYGWQSPNTGDVFGNNSFGELECAQKYYSSGTVDEVIVWIGYAAGTSGSTSAKIYSIDGTTKAPSTAIGTSAAVGMSSIVTTAFTAYAFSPAVTVSSAFAASVVFPTTTGDTVSVVSNAMGCSTTDSLSWINFPTVGWLSTPSAIGSNPNTDLWIFPVGTLTSGINEYSTVGLSLLGAFPNPANEFTSLKYRIDAAGVVSTQVFDLTGRIIQQSSEKLNAGTHDVKISLKDLAPGNYYYTVKTGAAQLTSKFVVTK